jgi:UDP-N-acetylmuramate dehydrogenase
MKISENVCLAGLTTMRLGGQARYVVEITTKADLVKTIQLADAKKLPVFVLGGGSNVIAGDSGYNGIIILNRIAGFKQLRQNRQTATFQIGAGENWDSVVERLTAGGLSGVECLSAIPGVAGATPVQNVGAYGQEIADCLQQLEAYDTATNKFVILSHDDCRFSYRNSIFKNPATRHHVITSITLRLHKSNLVPPFYPALETYLKEHRVRDFSPSSIRAAIIAIRAGKLPPVDKIASAGSFFKNPITSKVAADKLLANFPDMPHWPINGDQQKLSAGWLIDQAGLKGFEHYGFQIYPQNALVIVNRGAGNYGGLNKFRAEIIARVYDKFGVKLEQEPEEL